VRSILRIRGLRHPTVVFLPCLLTTYLKPQWQPALLLGVLLFATIGLELCSPLILRHFIDAARASQPLDVLRNAALLYIGVALVRQAISVGARYLSEKVGWVATPCAKI